MTTDPPVELRVDRLAERRAMVESLGIGVPLMVRNTPIETRTNEMDEETAVQSRIVELASRVPSTLFTRLPHPRAVPRLIVMDGCNIGRASCGLGREKVNCLGLLCVVRYFVARNFDVVIFIPSSYNNSLNQNVAYSPILPKLQTMGVLGFTASRTSANPRRRGQLNYDDLYVLEYANRHGGAVLSGDFFEDILNDPRHAQFVDLIRRRRFGIRFHVFGELLAKVDRDIFYRCSPEVYSLGANEVVVNAERMSSRLFAAPSTPEFDLAKTRRQTSWSRERQRQLLDSIDGLLDLTIAESNLKVIELRPGLATGVNVEGEDEPRSAPMQRLLVSLKFRVLSQLPTLV